MARPHTRRRVGNNGDAGVEAPPLNRKPSSRDKRRCIYRSVLGVACQTHAESQAAARRVVVEA
jgi:hypothetical protein